MKKWLVLFVIVDLVFVGLVLRISTTSGRNIAAYNDPFYAELTDGQKQKYDFVQSLQFSLGTDTLTLQTDRLQSLCQTNSLIELKFAAVNTAVAGAQPSISHIYSCQNIRKDLSTAALKTTIQDFVKTHKQKNVKLEDSEIKSSGIYPGEEFPTDWMLSEISITGELNFTVNSFEMEKVHTDHRFEFNLATFVK